MHKDYFPSQVTKKKCFFLPVSLFISLLAYSISTNRYLNKSCKSTADRITFPPCISLNIYHIEVSVKFRSLDSADTGSFFHRRTENGSFIAQKAYTSATSCDNCGAADSDKRNAFLVYYPTNFYLIICFLTKRTECFFRVYLTLELN